MKNITLSALIKRINRRLAQNDEQLHVLRGQRWWSNLGDYYITNLRVNAPSRCIVDTHVDPEALGRELGVLRPFERVHP